MTNEIKEILDRAKNLKYKCDCCEEIAPGKYMMRNDKQTDNLIEAVYIIDKLLDYITNLQEENRKLKELKYKFFDCSGDEESFTLEDYLELGNKLYDLQEKNEKLKEIIKDNTILVKDENGNYQECNINPLDYKSRIDKANQLIEKQKKKMYKSRNKIAMYILMNLENILRGDE